MTVTATAIFPQLAEISCATATAANTTWTDSPDDDVLLWTAGNDGSEIHRVTCAPRATCTAGWVGLYVSPDSGTTFYLYDSLAVAANTVSTTVLPIQLVFSLITPTTPLIMGPGDLLHFAYTIVLADGMTATAQGYHY
jgi:hypothetical protein